MHITGTSNHMDECGSVYFMQYIVQSRQNVQKTNNKCIEQWNFGKTRQETKVQRSKKVQRNNSLKFMFFEHFTLKS